MISTSLIAGITGIHKYAWPAAYPLKNSLDRITCIQIKAFIAGGMA
jgi:hypothetical protein